MIGSGAGGDGYSGLMVVDHIHEMESEGICMTEAGKLDLLTMVSIDAVGIVGGLRFLAVMGRELPRAHGGTLDLSS